MHILRLHTDWEIIPELLLYCFFFFVFSYFQHSCRSEEMYQAINVFLLIKLKIKKILGGKGLFAEPVLKPAFNKKMHQILEIYAIF